MLRSIARTLSFFSKWLAEVLRQPSLMLSLIIGPFLILLAFGEGIKSGVPQPRTLFVDRGPAGEPDRMRPIPQELNQYLTVVGQTRDIEEARSKLVHGEVDLVAVLPSDPMEAVRNGNHARIEILTNEIDPVRKSYAKAYINDQVATLNQKTIQKAIVDAQGSADDILGLVAQARRYLQLMRSVQGDVSKTRDQVRELKGIIDPLLRTANQATAAAQGVSFVVPGLAQPFEQARRLAQFVDDLKRNVDQLDARLATATSGAGAPLPEELSRIEASLTDIDRTTTEIKAIPPEVLSAPFKLELENVAPFVPTYIGFYSPAVLALLVQHLAITLGALSMARIRLLGLMELLQTSPVRPAEAVVGNYLSYGGLCAIAAGSLVVLLVFGLGVPVFGSAWLVAAMLALLITASLGIGFVISMVSSSEQQAAQIAMLVLIASVFFGGFIVSIDTIIQPVRVLAYVLPATYAIRTLQDVMLRGVLRTPADIGILAIAGVALFVATIHLFRREYRPR
jgi:ABC-2 type transport system permease protein